MAWPRTGFTLLEMSVTLVIVGLVAAASWTAGSQVLESVRRVQTNNKLDTIETALMQFRTVNNRLPCPADATLAITMGNYGVEAANPGSCTGGGPAANQVDANNNVAEGAVPFKTLGLPAEFMYDGWGRKFVYAVNYNITATLAMLEQSLNDPGKLSIADASGNVRDAQVYSTSPSTVYTWPTAIYALVSYGPDGHGGYLKSGTRMSASSTDADEQTNCHCDGNANETVYSASYVQKDMTATFGDIVRYKDRWQMQSFDDINTGSAVNSSNIVSPAGKGRVTTLGFEADGTKPDDMVGSAIAVADVNGDGIPDLIIGVPMANSQSGYVYVIFGSQYGFPNPLPLSNLNGSNGFRLDGTLGAGRSIGESVAAGDINGDGIADIVIGAPTANVSSGCVYVVFGHSGPWPASELLNTGAGNLIDGNQGFRLDGVNSNDKVGASVAVADINHDGYGDLIMGAPWAPNGTQKGYVYTVFGHAAPWSVSQQLTTNWLSNGACGGLDPCPAVAAVNGFRLDGVTAGDYAGYAVAAGDIKGDKYPDVIIGAYQANTNLGYVYVVLGHAAAWMTTQALNTGAGNLIDGTHGFRIDGTATSGDIGSSVAVGDINGDGYADLVLGVSNGNSAAGYTYVIFGHPAPWSATQQLNTGAGSLIDGTQGFRLDGVTANDWAGQSVAVADINCDGYADLVIGAPHANANGGYTYAVFGKSGGVSSPWGTGAVNYVLNTGAGNLIDGVQGFRLEGVAGSESGWIVGTGDINGNGLSDVFTSAPLLNGMKGGVYAAFGRPSWPATTSVTTLR